MTTINLHLNECPYISACPTNIVKNNDDLQSQTQKCRVDEISINHSHIIVDYANSIVFFFSTKILHKSMNVFLHTYTKTSIPESNTSKRQGTLSCIW